MYRLFIFVILILFFNDCVLSQNINQLKSDFEIQEGIDKAITGIILSRALSKDAPGEAMSYIEFSHKHAELTGNKDLLGNSLLTKAMISMAMGEKQQAVLLAKNAVEILREVKSTDFLSALDYYADIKFQTSNFVDIESIYNELIRIYKLEKKYYDLGFSAHRLGLIYENKKDFKKSIENYQIAVESFEKGKNFEEQIQSYFNLSGVFNNYGNYNSALTTLVKALDLAKKTNNVNWISKINERIDKVKVNENLDLTDETSFEKDNKIHQNAKIDTLLRRQKLSLEEIEKLSKEKQLIELKIRVQQDEYERKILEEKLAKLRVVEALQKEKLEALNLKLALENERLINDNKTIENHRLYLTLFGSFLVLLLIVVAFIIKYKSNIQLNQKNEFISKQNAKIEEQSEKISQSISYAKEIQEALLLSENHFLSTVNNSFVIHLPKDKVSGDFLWYHKTESDLIICVADCTGHGVPGAFITIVLSSILDKIVQNDKIYSPDKILESTCEKLKQLITQDDDDFKSLKSFKGGMDASIIRVNSKTKDIEFAGARSSMVICTNGRVDVLKGTRRSVDTSASEKDFELITKTLKSGDRIFLYTDGFADQKGGENQEKYYINRFRDLLQESAELKIKEQGNFILDEFYSWKRDLEQVDDVLIVGLVI